MPSSNDTEDEATPPKPQDPTTPRRTPAKHSPNVTPARKASAKLATPKSAPQAHGKTAGKKPEATLLGDFLLGRPSPSRLRNQRRKSLELLKAEMKKGMVEQVRPPGAVKDRVKQWQKASAGAGAPQTPAYDQDEIVVEVEEDTASEGGGEAKDARPGREKSAAAFARARARSASAPRKRVVSDDHWMKNKDQPSKAKAKENIKPGAGKVLPKDFTQTNWANQPLGSKIEDWAKRTHDAPAPKKEKERLPGVKKSRESTPDGDGIRVFPSRGNSVDDGIRIKPSNDSLKENRSYGRSSGERLAGKKKSRESTPDDGIRVFPSRSNSIDDGIRVRPGPDPSRRKDGDDQNEHHAPRRKSEKHLRSLQTESSQPTETVDGDESSWTGASGRLPNGSRREDEKDQSIDGTADIPLGSSAFSVLDIPVGAEANNIKGQTSKPKPQRRNSVTVPKVLKKVFSEGMKIMQDTVEPPRAGANHPPSIESWLYNTTDPFVDRPAVPQSVVETATSDSTRSKDTQINTDKTEEPKSAGRRKRRVRRSASLEKEEDMSSKGENIPRPASVPNANTLNDYMEKGVDRTPPPNPVGLKRTPATRNASSPAKARWTPLKDALESAFRGESATYRTTVIPDASDDREKDRIERQNSASPNHEPLSRKSLRPLEISPNERKTGDLGAPFRSPINRAAPTTGNYRLSTIASSDALSTLSGTLSETASMISETTVTQNDGMKSNFTRHRSNKPKAGLKRRLTKHSDLISVLSLPDTAGPRRGGSIRSARSVRTTRNRLETATLEELMQELAEDEAKYMRELRTLVDGVIPVLLTCVLSKSKSAIAAGLFNPNCDKAEPAITKPIIDMGVALERLKKSHKRIPLKDADLLVNWAYGAHKVYEDYLAAWRMGFQDVIVNLAPASRANSPKADDSIKDGLPLNAEGDVINGDGERVDVAFLLKRPLVRIKHMAKILKGINMHRTTTNVTDVSNRWADLIEMTRRRGREEVARLEDQAANNTDPTRVRDLRTLAPLEDVQIDRTRQVKAKDFFTLDLPHSTGQRMNCRVEVVLRDKPRDNADAGDVLICEVDTVGRWLLFQPVEWSQISARMGDEKNMVVVMIRGTYKSESWRQIFSMSAEDEETAKEWVEMLGSSPLPASLVPDDLYSTVSYSEVSYMTRDSSPERERLRRSPSPVGSEIPFGERIGKRHGRPSSSHSRRQNTSVDNGRPRPLSTISGHSSAGSRPLDLNEAMERAGEDLKRPTPSRYHGRHKSESPIVPNSYATGKNDIYDPERTPTRNSNHERPASSDGKRDSRSFDNDGRPSMTPSMEMPVVQKKRDSIPPPSPEIRGRLDEPLKESKVTTPTKPSHSREDGAPPPPEHRTPSPVLKQSIQLDPPSSRIKRRGSSPLKHEYQPSMASETSSESEISESEASDAAISESSEDEDLDEDISTPLPGEAIYNRRSPPESLSSLPNMSLGPSNSVSQAPYRTVPSQPTVAPLKFTATMFCWNPMGRWEKLYPSLCCVVVTPGLIEAYTMNSSHAKEQSGQETAHSAKTTERPLIAMELTPLVPLRQSNATDIDLRSPPIARSLFKNNRPIMFRSPCVEDCYALYRAIHHSRMHNPTYMALEQARTVSAYGGGANSADGGANRRRSWFGLGRKQSYRASTRAPSTAADSENSSNSFASAFSALKRLSGGGGFNIAKSTVDSHTMMSGGLGDPDSGNASMYTSSSGSGTTPPRTPTASMSGDGSSGNVALGTNLGSSNLKVRAYRLEMKKWNDLGAARVTVATPPPGMRQASSLYTGPERRIIVVSKHAAKKEAEENGHNLPLNSNENKDPATNPQMGVILDVVLGSACFSRVGVVGIVVNVWEDIVGDDGRVGMAPGVGGVSGRTRKWMLQCGSAMEARWIFGLLGGGAGGVGGMRF